MLEPIWEFFLVEQNREASGAVLAALGAVWLYLTGRLGAFIAWTRGKKDEPEAAQDTKLDDRGQVILTTDAFLAHLEKEREKAKAELADAHDADRSQLRDRIGELERQIAEPEKALAEAKARIADLEDQLKQFGNEIGGDRLAEAQDALQRLDYSKADEIFAEVAAREALALDRAARAAFGRGEIAEARVRWGDAAEHYAEAARLKPGYDTLLNAGLFLWRAGRHTDAITCEEKLVEIAREEFGSSANETATAMNNLAGSYRALAQYEKAEPLYREALEVTRAALGAAHPDYGTRLNNLAGLLQDTGRLEEAEPLFREALAVTRGALGAAHPVYAIRLNNLALLLKATGRLEEAEPLFREALEVTRAALGTAHPDYGTRLNNLAGLLQATSRFEEAEPLFREGLEVRRAALGVAHPDYAESLNNLALLLQETGRLEEAEPLYRDAVRIWEAALGAEHPSTKLGQANLQRLLTEMGRD